METDQQTKETTPVTSTDASQAQGGGAQTSTPTANVLDANVRAATDGVKPLTKPDYLPAEFWDSANGVNVEKMASTIKGQQDVIAANSAVLKDVKAYSPYDKLFDGDKPGDYKEFIDFGNINKIPLETMKSFITYANAKREEDVKQFNDNRVSAINHQYSKSELATIQAVCNRYLEDNNDSLTDDEKELFKELINPETATKGSIALAYKMAKKGNPSYQFITGEKLYTLPQRREMIEKQKDAVRNATPSQRWIEEEKLEKMRGEFYKELSRNKQAGNF